LGPVGRYLDRAIDPGTPDWTAARLRMRGRLRVGRWLPFTATEELAPHFGFSWTARVAGLISGSDGYGDGCGRMDWKLLGLFPVAHGDGPDVSRSSAERAGAEAVWLPTALRPELGVEWTVESPDVVTARFEVDGHPLALTLRLADDGRPAAFWLDRWGDPDSTGTWAPHRFGGEFDEHHRFGGLSIPSAGRIGWHYGTDRWPDGEFFRFRVTDLRPLAA
jgi:hypothetical protein